MSGEEAGVECLAFVPHLWAVAHQILGQRLFGRDPQPHPHKYVDGAQIRS
jgi:hypothetical protein